MSNFIGKLMVQLHLVISVLAFAWAASVYFDVVDWGWKVPRKEIDHAFASEYDKRFAHQKEGLRIRDFAYAPVSSAWADVRTAEGHFVQNNLWYQRELLRLNSDPNPIEVSYLQYVDGQLELDTPKQPLGKPVYQEKPIPELKKSLKAYLKDFNLLVEEIGKVEKEFLSWQIKYQENIEAKLGKFDKDNKKIGPGLQDLRQQEFDLQASFHEEIRYLRPREADFSRDAGIYRERREDLEKRRKFLLGQLPERSREKFAK